MPIFKSKKVTLNLESLSLEQLLFEADTSEDPQVTYAALTRAEALAPESLEVQQKLLLHGRLHQRNPKAIDFSVIKSYLLHGFEHPEKFREEQLKTMARELFDEPRLTRCLAMAPVPTAFLKAYLTQLSKDYVRIFIASDSSHSPRLLGFSFKGKLPQYLARPVSVVISNILSSPYLSQEEANVLSKAFYSAFYAFVQGEVKELDRLLGAQVRAQLTRE